MHSFCSEAEGFVNAGSGQVVADEEIDWFSENEQPLQDLSTLDVVVESFGWLDIFFLSLRIGTTFWLGMGEAG